MKLWYKALLLVAIPLISQFLLGGLLVSQYFKIEEYNRQEAHARKLLTIFVATVQEVERTAGWLTHEPKKPNQETIRVFFSPFTRVAPALFKRIASSVEQLDAAIREDPSDSQAAARCSEQLNEVLNKAREAAAAIKSQDWPVVMKFSKDIPQTADTAIVALRNVIDSENEICRRLSADKQQAEQQTTRLLVFGIFANIFMGIGLLLFFSRSVGRRLRSVLNNVSRIAREEPPLPAPDRGDEFALLDSGLHDLAKQLFEQRGREKAIIDDCPGLIFSLSHDGYFTGANPAALKALSLTADMMAQTSLAQLVVEADAPLCLPFTTSTESQTTIDSKLRLRGDNGSTKTLSITALWCAVERQWFCIAEDITSQQAAAECRREITVMVNHDLRSPLSSMLAVYELAGTSALGQLHGSTRHLMESASGEGTRMLNLINSLLDLEKISAGRFELQSQEVNLRQAIGEASDSAACLLADRQLKLSVACPDSLELTVDAKSIASVLTNLLFSTADRAAQGSEIHLEVARRDRVIDIRVQYSGVPLETTPSEQHMNPLDFELSLCDKLVRMNGGLLKRSNDGQVTVVEVTFPLETPAPYLVH